MYRFKASKNGVPRVVWKKTYRNSGIVKPSQVNAGSGTTPTIMDNGYVAITDNADPMNVVVYRTASKLHGEKRKVCEVPVFEPGGERDRELADHRRTLADRREQLRLPGPAGPQRRRRDRGRASPAST